MNNFLLCTDMDRTLIPNGAQSESAGARVLFAKLAKQPQATLVYVTGRHQTLIQDAIHDFQLPAPDFAIADVGATIYEVNDGIWSAWDEWSQEIDSDWKGKSAKQLHMLIADLTSLTLQEPEKQSRHKLSYYTVLTADEKEILKAVHEKMQKDGIQANLIWSIDEQANVGLLDILPASANKLLAIEFLMKKRGFTIETTVFAGDSGNDLDVLLSPLHAVLVANASSEVKAIVANSNLASSLYQAKGNHLGMNGNYSAGILEGVSHYLPDVGNWLKEQAS